jgi:hypothetical protein
MALKKAGEPKLKGARARQHRRWASACRRRTVDALLDAFGNMPRHRGEWRYSRKKGERSLLTVARFLHDHAKF